MKQIDIENRRLLEGFKIVTSSQANMLKVLGKLSVAGVGRCEKICSRMPYRANGDVFAIVVYGYNQPIDKAFYDVYTLSRKHSKDLSGEPVSIAEFNATFDQLLSY